MVSLFLFRPEHLAGGGSGWFREPCKPLQVDGIHHYDSYQSRQFLEAKKQI